MKRKITLSIALALSVVIVALMSSDSTVTAQNQLRVVADTGVITLGPNQVLRVTATGDGKLLGNILTIRFRQIEYAQESNCNDNEACKLNVAAQATSNPIMLAPGEAVSLELVASTYGRGMILSNSSGVRATAMIIDKVTGKTTSQIIMANTEGDFH
jgi:hypothetical protein